MEKEFASYEIALAVKELGFDEPCIGYYTNNKILCIYQNEDYFLSDEQPNNYLESPLHQQSISFLNKLMYKNCDKASYSPEWVYFDGINCEELEKSIKKAIEIIKKQ